jgi:hypothetical protein
MTLTVGYCIPVVSRGSFDFSKLQISRQTKLRTHQVTKVQRPSYNSTNSNRLFVAPTNLKSLVPCSARISLHFVRVTKNLITTNKLRLLLPLSTHRLPRRFNQSLTPHPQKSQNQNQHAKQLYHHTRYCQSPILALHHVSISHYISSKQLTLLSQTSLKSTTPSKSGWICSAKGLQAHPQRSLPFFATLYAIATPTQIPT